MTKVYAKNNYHIYIKYIFYLGPFITGEWPTAISHQCTRNPPFIFYQGALIHSSSSSIFSGDLDVIKCLGTGCPIILARSVHLSYYSVSDNNYGTPCISYVCRERLSKDFGGREVVGIIKRKQNLYGLQTRSLSVKRQTVISDGRSKLSAQIAFRAWKFNAESLR